MTSHDLTGLLIIVGIAVGAILLLLAVTGWHPYVRWVHRRQIRALRGQWRPPERSRFWNVFYAAFLGGILASSMLLVWESLRVSEGEGDRTIFGLSLFFALFLPVNFVAIALFRELFRGWEADTTKWKCGTWRGIPVKELQSNRVHDVIALEYEETVRDEASGLVRKVVATHTSMYEGGRTGGVSPRKRAGISTSNKGPIVIARFRQIQEERMKALLARDDHREEVPFASGFVLGDIYFTPGDPILLLFGFDRSIDPANPTPDPIREFIIRHPQTFGDVKPTTEILFVPDLYPDFADRSMVPAKRPTDMEYLIEHLTRIASERGERTLDESKFDQALRSMRGGERKPYDLGEERKG